MVLFEKNWGTVFAFFCGCLRLIALTGCSFKYQRILRKHSTSHEIMLRDWSRLNNILSTFCNGKGREVTRVETVRSIIDTAAESRYGPDETLRHYRYLVRRSLIIRSYFKKGIHKRTGEPLKPSTMKYYDWRLRRLAISIEIRKRAIRVMAKRGMLEHRKRAITMTFVERPGAPAFRVIQGGGR